jgi:mannose-6-phosphate isomerase-like protein (cupin superfamily)
MSITAARTQKFTARGAPLLARGATMELLGRAPQLWLHLKVYAEGGENSVHFHAEEDHAFIVLAGRATFVDADGQTTDVEAFDGMLVPRGAPYAFRSTGDENLVMVRVGAGAGELDPAGGAGGFPSPAARGTLDGKPIASAGEGVPIPGQFFAPR